MNAQECDCEMEVKQKADSVAEAREQAMDLRFEGANAPDFRWVSPDQRVTKLSWLLAFKPVSEPTVTGRCPFPGCNHTYSEKRFRTLLCHTRRHLIERTSKKGLTTCDIDGYEGWTEANRRAFHEGLARFGLWCCIRDKKLVSFTTSMTMEGCEVSYTTCRTCKRCPPFKPTKLLIPGDPTERQAQRTETGMNRECVEVEKKTGGDETVASYRELLLRAGAVVPVPSGETKGEEVGCDASPS